MWIKRCENEQTGVVCLIVKATYNESMLDAPRQNWAVYSALSKPIDQRHARALSLQERFARYENLYRLVCQRPLEAGDRQRLEAWRWQKKLALRLQMNVAFRAWE